MSSKKKKRKRRVFLARFALLLAATAAAICVICVLAKSAAKKASEGSAEEASSEDPQDSPQSTSSEAEGLVIVIDPGHGFGDVGNEAGFLTNSEYVYTLLYAEELKEKLEAMGATVFLTHDGESYPSEDELTEKIAEYGITFSSWAVRATAGDDIFNKYERVMYTAILDYEYGVDFFLSIHFNSNESASVSGAAIYYYESNPDVSVCEAFAKEVMAQLGYSSSYSGIYATSYAESYAVIKYSDFASALIECAFMTNEYDAANIGSYTWRDQMTTILAEAIINALTDQS